MKRNSSGAWIACILLSLISCGSVQLENQSKYLSPDEFFDLTESDCEINIENFPASLGAKVIYCHRYKANGDLNFGIVELDGPHGRLPATVLVRRYEQPSQTTILFVHGGPNGSIYAGGGIADHNRVPRKILDAIYDCNIMLLDAAYAGSSERTYYPSPDGKIALDEIDYLAEQFEEYRPNKNVILGESFGASLVAFSKIEKTPEYFVIPYMARVDIVEYLDNIVAEGGNIKNETAIYSIKKQKIIEINQENFLSDFYRYTDFQHTDLVDFFQNSENRKNLKNIIFHGNDGKSPWKKYSQKLDQWKVPYSVIAGAGHSDVYARDSEESNKAYQPLYDDICARSGWKEYTNF
jgi:pimeloyl-ACP methyl ester carboxylesterase